METKRLLRTLLAAILLPACGDGGPDRNPPVPSWGGAARLEFDDTGSAGSPHVACTPTGEAVAVWSQTDGLRLHLWAAGFAPAAGWGAPQPLENNSIGNADCPQVAVEAGGSAVAVWQQHDGIRWNIWSAFRPAGGSWGAPSLIENDDVGDALRPQAVMDGQGNALSVWSQTDPVRFNLWANVRSAGSGWGTAAKIESEDFGNASEPSLAADGAGSAVAVWAQFDGTRYNIRANRYAAGTGWGPDGLIETDDTAGARNPRAAMDGAGNAFAVWEQSDGIRESIRANRCVAGGGWGAAQLIESDETGSAWVPRIGADGAGNALAVWQQHDGIRWNVWSNRFTFGVGWGAPQLVEAYEFANAEDPRLAMNAAGQAVVVWRQFDGIRHDPWAARAAPGGGWSQAEGLEAQPGTVSSVEIAIDGAGRAHAVWSQSDGLRYSLWAARSR